MTILIDGNEVEVSNAAILNDVIQVIKDMTIQEALAYEESTFEIEEITSRASGILSLSKSQRGELSVFYSRYSEVEELREELSETQEELSTARGEISTIAQAIRDLGTGVPTLSKLMTFLDAVKAAIHYE